MAWLFCSPVHAACLDLASLMFFFFFFSLYSYCYCFLTVSLAFLFHVCPFFSLLSFSSAVSLQLFSLVSFHLSVISWFTHNFTTRPHRKNKYWHSARNLQVQQILQPVDPQAIPSLMRTHLDSEGDKDGRMASQLSQPSELTQPSSTGKPQRGAAHRVESWAVGVTGFHFTVVAAAVLFVCLCLCQEEPPPPTNPPVVFNHLWFWTFLWAPPTIPLGMSNFVFCLLICHTQSLSVLWGELQLHPSVPCNPLVSSFDLVLPLFLLCFATFFPMCLI